MKSSLLLIPTVLGLCVSFSAMGAGSPSSPIQLTNYSGGETIRYPVPLIRGTLADTSLTSVEVINETSTRDTAKMKCLAHNGRFKALTELVPGKNKIVIKAGKDSRALELTYKPQTNPYVVRVVYAADSTGDTSYQTPIKNDPQNYAEKLGTMMILMQTFTAESMNDMGMGRVTFNLEFDEKGKVKVHVLKCNKTATEVAQIPGGRGGLYGYLNGQLNKQLPDAKAKNVMLPAFSRFNPETHHSTAYTALGAGNLALFGGSNLYCYPSGLADVQRAYMDATVIDTANYSSDSNGRHTFWSNASTSIGNTLHELGHAFGLPHARDGFDIMRRGGDWFSRFWVLQEAPAKGGKTAKPFEDNRVAQWTIASAAFLRATPWFALDERTYPKEEHIQARAGNKPGEIVVSSSDGLGGVCLGSPGSMASAVPMDWLKPAPKEVVVDTKEYLKALEGPKGWLRIIDVNGHVKNIYVKDVLPGWGGAATQSASAKAK